MVSAKAIQQNMIVYCMNIGLGSFDNISSWSREDAPRAGT